MCVHVHVEAKLQWRSLRQWSSSWIWAFWGQETFTYWSCSYFMFLSYSIYVPEPCDPHQKDQVINHLRNIKLLFSCVDYSMMTPQFVKQKSHLLHPQYNLRTLPISDFFFFFVLFCFCFCFCLLGIYYAVTQTYLTIDNSISITKRIQNTAFSASFFLVFYWEQQKKLLTVQLWDLSAISKIW